jgi:hypothetical protein
MDAAHTAAAVVQRDSFRSSHFESSPACGRPHSGDLHNGLPDVENQHFPIIAPAQPLSVQEGQSRFDARTRNQQFRFCTHDKGMLTT